MSLLPSAKTWKSSLTQIDEQDQSNIYSILNSIKSNKDANCFLKPVDIKLFPDYWKAVKNRPMDISTIESKLHLKRYHLIQDVFDDFQLIWDNCRTYNKEGFEIFIQAERMEAFCKVLFEKYYHIQKLEQKNYGKEFDTNVYDEEAFNDPNYYQENINIVDPYYRNLKEKIYLKRWINRIKQEELMELINNNTIVQKYLKKDGKKKIILIEKMEKDDISVLMNELKKMGK